MMEELLGSVQGMLAASGRAAEKRAVVQAAYAMGQKDGAGRGCIMIRLDASMDWWTCFIYGLLYCDRIVIIDSGMDRRRVNEIGAECHVERIYSWNEQRELTVECRAQEKLQTEEQELILYTTGTTGKPKGVVISVKNCLECIMDMRDKLVAGSQDVSLHILSNAHALGLAVSTLFFLFGGDVHCCSDVVDFYSEMITEKYHRVALQPAMLASLGDDDRVLRALRGMRSVMVGGGPLHRTVYRKLLHEGIKIVNIYGATECYPAIACTDLREGSPMDLGVRALKGVEAAISKEQEILVRGAAVHQRYMDGSKICSEDGWYHTGDLGELRNGKIYISSRMDEVVILDNGFKVNLQELEERLCGIQGVEDALVYWKDRGLYANIQRGDGAVVTEEDIREKLFYYEEIEIRFVKSIPLHNGKKKRRLNP